MIKRISIAGVLFAFGVSACASSPSRELLDARGAYARASAGPAATAAPADLHKAKVSLDKAEAAFQNDMPDQRDLAYVAERRAELSEVIANQASHAKTQAHAETALANEKDADHRETKQDLERTKVDLANAENSAANQKQHAADSDSRAVAADQRAADADSRLKTMQLELAKWAAVKEEARGVVITLSGSVLFASDKATLLPEARTRLGQVSAALLESKERHLTIEGYTDSQGKDSYNLDLSQRRADAVRVFLISTGYPADLIVAHGAGNTMAIADNATAEGRANNRRVEIVVAPAHAMSMR